MPSFSEGCPRAALEALNLGIPCILRNVDGNNELVNDKNKNGKVFNKNENLSQIMIAEAKKSVQRIYYSSLLPKNFYKVM